MMEEPPASTSGGASQANSDPAHRETSSSRFRFKSERRSRHRHEHSRRHDRDDRRDRHDGSTNTDEEQERRSHRRHHRRKRHRDTTPPMKVLAEDPLGNEPIIPDPAPIDPEVAFRESLFDAMADDEGAQFWEGVYGQPIHTYSDVKEGPLGELERMSEDEYAAYVRGKMYEKTHQYLLEEKARREAAKRERERLAQEGLKEEQEAARFRQQVEESLRRGEERKSRRAWIEIWDGYRESWAQLGRRPGDEDGHGDATTTTTRPPPTSRTTIPWPVASGQRKDVDARAIERFFLYAPTGGQPREAQLAAVLKTERVRWHPDKIQQRLGGQDVDPAVMQTVTEVFQVIDRMWGEVR